MLGPVSVEPGELREFEAERPRLFAVAYRLLGSASEAEDAVQDTFLRWNSADHAAVRNPAAWLTKVLTNLCLNRLTSARARRESYVGPWLPEPVATGDGVEGPLATVERRDTVSMAFLLLLERLTPPERAVFVLREAFDYGHREIAGILDLTEANCQQLYRRARSRIAEERPRFAASREDGHRIARRFLAAARGGDLGRLESLLADDVVAWADGGGRTSAARRPVRGARRVARYLSGWMSRDVPGLRTSVTEVNGEPAILGIAEGQLLVAVVLDIADGRVAAVRTVNNPGKLGYLATQVL
ncbi:RNA polymerase sigma-70 factor [Qaidamihabitans albus]|uniref:RNA polymerase sigma-70 factor n=1 Tax=Qaidamihabitans albus TaxID=2795733 RepID=UPI0018F246AD|nr:RNA polymerase sigma-70 factor [Qaidamihabitans albus]